tara:strand:- start:1023 stop:1328 length:306 start_codon:yes stop_codon:yes gene_type:complete
MEIDDKIAVGIKLYIGQDINMGSNPEEFEKFVTCKVSGIDLGFDNVLHCKYYDDMSGYIYFHFDSPIKRGTLEVFFDDHEIIDSLELHPKEKIPEEDLEKV